MTGKRCGHEGCNKRAFGVEGTRTKFKIPGEGMVTVRSRERGPLGATKADVRQRRHQDAELWLQHAREGRMVNVVSKRCGHQGCSKQPSHGAQDTRKAEFCFQRASDRGWSTLRGVFVSNTPSTT